MNSPDAKGNKSARCDRPACSAAAAWEGDVAPLASAERALPGVRAGAFASGVYCHMKKEEVVVVQPNRGEGHRCPVCSTVVYTDGPPTWRAVYECCQCRVRFSRWPLLAPLLPVRTCKTLKVGECPHFGSGVQT